MNFDSLFQQFAPQLVGAADPAAMGGGMPAPPSSPVDAGGSQPMPAAPMPLSPSMASAQPTGLGAKDMILQIAPMLVAAFAGGKNTHAQAALMQGLFRGQEAARAQHLQADQQEQERREKGARYMQQVAADAAQFEDVGQFQAYLQFAEQVGGALGIQPGQLTRTIPFPKTKAAAKKRAEAQARLSALESSANYKDIIGTPQESGLSVTMPDGERLTVAQLRERAGLALYDAKGAQVTPPAPVVKPPADTRTELEQHTDDMLAIWQEQNPGKPVTAAVRVQAREAAKKGLGQADDRPPQPVDPALRDLQRQGVELSNELKRSQIANKTTAGLPTAVQRRVDAKTRAFDMQPAVKRAAVMAEAAQFAGSLSPNTTNPADDQALIYAFAKAMDPESVVREGEYATVQKYAQSWAEKFGFDAKRIFSNTVFLTPAARANLKTTIQQKFGATRVQYDNLRRSYAEQINRMTGASDGADYLTDYGGGFPGGEAGSATPTTATPTLRWNPATGKLEPITR